MSSLSGGSGEIEAARKNLDMAKKLSAATTQTLRIAKERLKDAKQQVDHAETENNSAIDEVTKAEEYLKRVESKWKVIDVDLDDDDDGEKVDGAKKDDSNGGRRSGSSTNLSSENTRASSRDNVEEPIIDTRRRSGSLNSMRRRGSLQGHADDSSSENEMENLNKDSADREKRTRDKAKKKRQHQKNKLAESQKQKDNNTECIDLEEEDNCSTQGNYDDIPTDRVHDPKQQERVKHLKDKFGEDDDSYTKAVERSKKHRGNNHGESSLAEKSLSNNNPSKGPKQRLRGYRSYGRANLERGGGRFDESDDLLDAAAPQQRSTKLSVKRLTKRQIRDSSSREKRKHSDSAIEVDNNVDDVMRTLAAVSNERYEDKPKKVVELPSLGIGRTRDGRVGKAAKKKSPISSMNSHLKSTLGNDTCESDGDEFMSKPIPKKKGKKSKFKSQGGQFDSSVDKYEDSGWLAPMREPVKRKVKGA